MANETMYVYTTSEVSKRLNIAASTIRKYAAALESHGHTFEMINSGRRFVEADIALLTRMREISAESKMPIESIASIMAATPAAPQSVARSSEERSNVAAEVSDAINAAVIAAITNEFAALREENAELKTMVEDLMREVKETRQLIVEAAPKPVAVEEPAATTEDVDKESDLSKQDEPAADLARETKQAPKRIWQFWK